MTIARQRKLSGSSQQSTVICPQSPFEREHSLKQPSQVRDTDAEADANSQAMGLLGIVKLQGSLMQGTDSSHNIQPKTDAVTPAVQPGECSRQTRELLRGNTNPDITHHQLGLPAAGGMPGPQLQLNRRIGIGVTADILDQVAQQHLQ